MGSTHIGPPFGPTLEGKSCLRTISVAESLQYWLLPWFQTFACSCAFVEDNIGFLSVLLWQCCYPKPCLPIQWLRIIVFVYLSSILPLKTSSGTVGDPDDPWFQDCHKKRKSSSNFRQWIRVQGISCRYFVCFLFVFTFIYFIYWSVETQSFSRGSALSLLIFWDISIPELIKKKGSLLTFISTYSFFSTPCTFIF